MTLKFQKVRKDHVCTLCHRRIPSGTKYWRDYGLEDRKEHSDCLAYEKKPKLTELELSKERRKARKS